MQQNYLQIQNSFSVNHYALASGAPTEGYHTQIQFGDVLASDPNIASPVGSLYTKTASGDTHLFFQNDSNASDVIQMTGLGTTNAANGGTAGGNLTYIDLPPFGLRLIGGVTNAFSGNRTVVAPGISSVLAFSAIPDDPNPNALASTVSGTTITIRTSNNIKVRYTVWGRI